MFNTQRILNILSFDLPHEITLQNNTIPAGKITLIREEDKYHFYRYIFDGTSFQKTHVGFIMVKDGSDFFQKTFHVDTIEEADIHL